MYKAQRTLFPVLLLLAMLLSKQEASAQQLTVVTTDGTEFTDSLTWIASMTFPEDQLLITYLDEALWSGSLSEIKVIRFDSGPLGISDNEALGSSGALLLYPNPATSEFGIINLPAGGATVCIYSIDGKRILEQEIYSSSETINIEDLEKGIYLVRVGEQSTRLIRL